MALFLCLAVIVSSGTYTSLTQEGRALDDDAELYADNGGVEDDTLGAGGSSGENSIVKAGGGDEKKDGTNGTNGTGNTSNGGSNGGVSGTNGAENSSNEENNNGANGTNDAANGSNGEDINSNEADKTDDIAVDLDNDGEEGEIIAGAKETVSGNEPEITDMETLLTVSGNDPFVLTTLQDLIDLVKDGSEEDLEGITLAGSEIEIGENGWISVKMNQDYTETLSVPDGVELVLDLNGYHLNVPDGTSVSNSSGVIVSGTLTLKDTAGKGGISAYGEIDDMRGIYVERNGIFNMEGGTVSGFRSGFNGAGVYVGNLGTFRMTGGTIENNSSESYGGGIFVNTTCDVVLSGEDTIFKNNSAEKGGAIAFEKFPNGKLTLDGIHLEDNYAEKNGGAFHVAVKGEVTLDDVTVDGNTAADGYGGGICMEANASSLILNHTELKNNSAGLGGGAVYMKGAKNAESTFEMNGGSAIGNGLKAGSETETYGGAFYLNGYTNAEIAGSNGDPVRINENHDAWYGGGFAVGANGSLKMQYVEVNDNTTWALNSSKYNYGGGFFSLSDTEMENVSVCRNRPSEGATYGGGGIVVGNDWNTGKNLTMKNCTVSDNRKGSHGGGGIVNFSYLDMEDCTVIGNTTEGSNGGGIWVQRTADVRDTLIQNNVTATGSGGGIYVSGSTASSLKLTDCEIFENTSGSHGGGVSATGGSVVTAVGTSFVGNTGFSGGAIIVSTLIVEEPVDGGNVSVFQNNTAISNGGAIYSYQPVIIRQTGVQITGNTAKGVGGGICSERSVTIEKEGVEISNNKASSNGGAIYAGAVNLKGTVIKNNVSSNWGGGIYLGGKGESILDSCTISGNRGLAGGGVSQRYCGSTLAIRGETKITDNATTTGYGGGVLIRGGVVTLENGEISGNTAVKGGGVDVCTNSTEDGAYEESEFIMLGGSVYDNEASKVGNDIRLDNKVNHTKNGVDYVRTASVTLPAASAISTGKVEGRYWEERQTAGTAAAIKSVERKTEAYNNFMNPSPTQNDDIGLTFVYGLTGDAVRVTRTDNTIEDYPTVNDAMNVALRDKELEDKSIAKISLLRNTIEDVSVPTGLTTILDLNGYTIEGDESSTITVEQGADLTITDSSAGQKGQIIGGEPVELRYKEGTKIIAGLMVYGRATLETGTIGNNYNENYETAVYTGVYVAQTGEFIMQNGKICGNNVNKYGRGVMVNDVETPEAGSGVTGGKFTMTGGSISGNARGVQLSGDGKAGGVHAVFEMSGSETARPVIENNTGASGSKGSRGTGLYADGRSEVTINNAAFRNNTGADWGGGIYAANNAQVTLQKVIFTGNSATYGGAASSTSGAVLKIDGCEMKGNTGRSGGGALLVWDGGKAEISATTFSENSTNSTGGVIYLNSTCMIEDSAMENNTSKGDGGAIRVASGTLTVEDTNITKNKAATNGGGISVTSGTVNINDGAEITENEAATSGGGIYRTAGTVNVTDAVIARNNAGRGGGLYSNSNSGNCTVTYTERSDTDTTESALGIYGNNALDGKDVYVKNTAAPAANVRVTLPAAPKKEYKWLNEKVGQAMAQNEAIIVTGGQEYYLTAFLGNPNTESAAQWNGQNYYTVQSAVDAAVSGGSVADGTIYLLRNVAEHVVIPADSDITVDLNHYTMYGWGDAIFTVEGKLTVQDNDNPEIGNDVSEGTSDSDAADDTSDTGASGNTSHSGAVSDAPDTDLSEGTSDNDAVGGAVSGMASQKGEAGVLGIMNSGTEGRAVYVKQGGEVTINGGVVEGFKAANGGAVYVEKDSQITINSGIFQNNTATSGGGMLYAAVNCRLDIYGGTFRNNTAVNGGAIKTESGCNFTISGGSFEENTATAASTNAWGGGVIYIVGNNVSYPSTLKITGGQFIRNSAGNADGGAIAMGAGKMEITAVQGKEKPKFEKNEAYAGGAVYVYADAQRGTMSSLLVDGAIFEENTTTNAGGALYYYDPKVNKALPTSDDYEISLKNTEFISNRSLKSVGGGAYISGWDTADANNAKGMPKLLVENCTFTGNESLSHGGGIRALCLSKMTVKGSSFKNNATSTSSGYWGGGFYASANKANEMETEVTGCTFTGNSAYHGGAMGVTGTYAPVRISGSAYTDNHAAAGGYGGAVGVGSCDLVLENGNSGQELTFKDNMAQTGGALYYYGGTMVMNGGLFEQNTSSGGGGAIFLYPYNNGSVKTEFIMNGGTLRDNEASSGGAIYFQNISNWQGNSITINGGEITDNTARSDRGGGIFAYSNYDASKERPTVNVSGGKISGNTAATYGGGIAAQYIKSINISGGEISGNSSGTDAGGVSVGEYVKAVVSGGTITGNSSKQGGGMAFNWTASLDLQQGGKVYGNTANVGKDLRYYYDHRNSSTFALEDPDQIFGEVDRLTANAWYDEIRDAVYRKGNTYKPPRRQLAFTLLYADRSDVVAVIGEDEYPTVQAAIDAIASDRYKQGSNIVMVKDSHETVDVLSGVKASLYLNGHTLSGVARAISCSGELTILDKDADGVTANYAESAGSGTGTITGKAYTNGGAILVDVGGKVTMLDGQIKNAQAEGEGGAVYVNYGSFVMDGNAAIVECRSTIGSAVSVRGVFGRFTMKGGEISGCINRRGSNTSTTEINGGGVIYVNAGRTDITGGTIRDNVSTEGSAIYMQSGKVNITGTEDDKPLICNNKAINRGGAIRMVGGTLNISNAVLRDNVVTAARSTTLSTGAGGAIYQEGGTIVMEEGTEITGNSAARGGAIFQWGGTLKMQDGEITGNVAELGGGLAQNPEATPTFTMQKGLLAGNLSKATHEGNDVYSLYEGAGSYDGFKYTPKATLIKASRMTGDMYDAWHNDVAPTDSERVGDSILEAEYITGMIDRSKGLALTAVNYALELEEEGKVPLRVKILSILERQSGDAQSKDGKYTHDGTGADKEELISQERTASDCLNDKKEGWLESDETYQYNGTTYHYIKGPDGTLYEQNQAVEWAAGSDGSDSNLIVRSFDTVTYQLSYTIEREEQSSGTAGLSGDDPERAPITDGMSYKVWISADLPCESEQALFDGTGLDYFQYSTVRKDGKNYQRITGYWEKIYSEESTAESASVPFTMKVGNLKNGDTIRPDFKVWIGGNAWNEENPASAESQRITVSAAPAYNLRLKRNSQLSYTGYFNLTTGEESSEKEMEAAKEDPESGDNIVYGTMMGYGVTLELLNPNSSEGIKGLQLPDGEISFDLSLKGNLTINNEQKEGDVAPYIWAYKENQKSDFGTNAYNTSNNFQMDWNDEDDLVKVTNYAYDGAPYNSGGNSYSCYSGGSWRLEDYSRNADGSGMTKARFRVNGYGFNNMLAGKPSQNSDVVTDPTLNNNATVAFSAGYIQLICPVEYEYGDLNAGENYVEIAVDGILSDLEIEGEEPVSRSDDTDLKNMVDFFGNDYKNHAKNETRYEDNYYCIITSANVLGGYGSGDGDIVFKTNNFYTETDEYMQGSERGESSTPLGTDVYIGGTMEYHSKSYDTRDETNTGYYIDNFDPATDNVVEFNYMTSLNVLQKFNGSIFTPVGAQEIVNEPHYFGDSIGGGAFTVGSNEQNASWNNAQTDKTRRFWLTVLYAAKPDGSNWEEQLTPKMEEKKDEDGNTVTDADGNPVMEAVKDEDGNPVMLSDGGVADMDAHREENLIYFKTLDELNQYFASQGKKGNCVGILYELRDCCVRKDRYVDCRMKAHTTKDFNKTGDTYVTTNDVRYFTTYRPEYKNAYVHANANDHTSEKSMWQSGLVNQFSWCSEELALKGGAYGTGNGTQPDNYKDVLRTEKAKGGLYAHYSDKYQDGYIKTEYENGTKKQGTHNGNFLGNSILLYTLDSDIRITNTDTISSSSNSRREQYNISQKQREANFAVMPSLAVSSKIKNYELVKNGTQSVEMKITVNLPKHLNYNDNSIEFDYTLPEDQNNPIGQEEAEKAKASMKWDTAVIRNADGTSSLILTTMVADMNLRMPKIRYRCTIGEPGSPDDVKENTSLTSVAMIETAYEETGRMTGVSHSQSVTITTIGSSKDSIWKSVGGDDSWNAGNLVDMGDNLVYRLHYRNLTEDGSEEEGISLLDVLPYTGDGRGTNFHGGYQVTEVRFIFDDEKDYNNFIGGNAEGADGSQARGAFRYQTSVSAEQLKAKTAPEVEGWTQLDVGNAERGTVSEPDHETVWTVAFDVSSLHLVQSGEKATSGIALYGKLPTVQAGQRVTVEVTLKPIKSEQGEKQEGKEEQTAEEQKPLDLYSNSFSYWNEGNRTPAECTKVSIQVAARSISGIVWLDQDQNGFYYKGTDDSDKGNYQKSADLLMRNVEVYLYTAGTIKGSDGQEKPNPYAETNEMTDGTPGALTAGGKTYYRAKDVHGNLLSAQTTDAKGQYKFSELGAGRYFVYFVDKDENYSVEKGERQLDFSQLSVTKRESEQTEYAVTSNKAYPYYGETKEEDGLYRLSYALITNQMDGGAGIELPEADQLNQADWNTPNWNLGLYYINQSVEKVWKQTDTIEEGTKVELTESIRPITGKDSLGNNTFGENIGTRTFTMAQRKDGTVSITSDDYDNLNVTVTSEPAESGKDNSEDIVWTVSDIALQAETAEISGSAVVPGKSQIVDYSMTEVRESVPKKSDPEEFELLKGYTVNREVSRETGEATTKYSIINTQVLHDIALTKVSRTNPDIMLGGAEFTVYREDNGKCGDRVTDATSDSNGSLTLSGLTGGTYLMKETKAPKGYAIDPTEYRIEITYKGAASGVDAEGFICENNKWNDPVIKVTQMTTGENNKVVYDSAVIYDETNKPLRNAVWSVEKKDSSERGILCRLGFTVDDECIYELPSTGGIGVFPYVAAGTLLLMAAVWLMMRKRREEASRKGHY